MPDLPWPMTGDALPDIPRLRGPGGRTWQVLLADDNPINLEVGQALLEELGVAVTTASDGREAVDKALTGRFDAVLMDMQMPRLDGMDATREIRLSPACSQVPIIAITGNAFDRNRAACLEAGMNDFISKPVDLWQLATVLGRLLKA